MIPINWSCLPPKGCECSILGAFVDSINRLWGTEYSNFECLHRTDRRTRQPEALWRDERSAAILAIERKSLVWPPDYVRDHATEHEFGGAINRGLGQHFKGHRCVLSLPRGIRAGKYLRRSHAARIAKAIVRNREAVLAGRVFGEREPIAWRFRLEKPDEFEPWESQEGINIRFASESLFDVERPDYQAAWPGVQLRLHKLVADAEEKFQSHRDATSILVLSAYAPLWMPISDDSIADALREHTPPPEIDQVWITVPPDWSEDEQAAYACIYKRTA